MLDDLPERLRAIADSLDGDEWEHPLSSAADCRRAAVEIERLQTKLLAITTATILASEQTRLNGEVKRLNHIRLRYKWRCEALLESMEKNRLEPELIQAELLAILSEEDER